MNKPLDRKNLTTAARAAELADEMRRHGFTVTGVEIEGRAIKVLTGGAKDRPSANPADLIEP